MGLVSPIIGAKSLEPKAVLVPHIYQGNTWSETLSLNGPDSEPFSWGYTEAMKPLPPAPEVPGKTEFERFDNAVRQILTVSKNDLLKMEAREKKKKERKKRKKS